jgi:diaminopimelate epimerase
MEFAKLHGTGNDFVLVDARVLDRDWTALARAMCDRHFGIGADGLILAAPSSRADLRMRIFNADGSEAEMSGNGMRCVVKFAVDRQIVTPRDGTLTVETGAGVMTVVVQLRDGAVARVREGMGRPRLDPRDIPVAVEAPAPVRRLDLVVNGIGLGVTPVSMGNPHAVLFQGLPVDDYPLAQFGHSVVGLLLLAFLI